MKRIEKIPASNVEQVQERSMKRVAIYARVSTMYDAQNNSYEAQVSYFMDYIRLHENWQLVGIYADRGISGARAKNRPEFLKMIEDCYSGSIDLIVTKSVSRFARNTVDTLNILRELKTRDMVCSFSVKIFCLRTQTENFCLHSWLALHRRNPVPFQKM